MLKNLMQNNILKNNISKTSTNIIEIGHLTVKKFTKANHAVIWDSDNLVMNTNIDFLKLFDRLVFLEQETASIKTNLQKAKAEIGLALENNSYNSEFVGSFSLKMSDSVFRITDINKVAIFEVNKLNTFDKTITVYEEEAGLEFSKMHDYILSINRMQLVSNVLAEHIVESELSINLLDKDLQKNQKILDKLAAEIRDIEFMLDILNTRILAITMRITPALNVLLELRVMVANLKYKFEKFVARLKYVELHIAICLLKTNTLDERKAYLTGIVKHQKEQVDKLDVLFSSMVTRHYDLMCKIAILYQKVLDLTAIANEIASYIQKMKTMIESGLLKAGSNIAIEYNADGFATIHSTLPKYPARPPRTRKVIKPKTMVFRLPPNPCPPLLPPCPDITKTKAPKATTTTTTLAPTGSDTTTTTTTKKPDHMCGAGYPLYSPCADFRTKYPVKTTQALGFVISYHTNSPGKTGENSCVNSTVYHSEEELQYLKDCIKKATMPSGYNLEYLDLKYPNTAIDEINRIGEATLTASSTPYASISWDYPFGTGVPDYTKNLPITCGYCAVKSRNPDLYRDLERVMSSLPRLARFSF